MIYNYGLEHFSNPSPVKRVNAFSDCDHFVFPIFLEIATTERGSSDSFFDS